MVYALKSIFLFNYPIWVCILAPFVQMSERSFYNAEMKSKQEWVFFINPETGRRTSNSLCLKCKNKCKQSYKAIVVFCPKYKSKRGAKSVKNRREYDNSCSPFLSTV